MLYLLAICGCILGAVVFFLPSIIGHFRRTAAIRNISALNALALLTLVCSLAWSWSLLATCAVWVSGLGPHQPEFERSSYRPTEWQRGYAFWPFSSQWRAAIGELTSEP